MATNYKVLGQSAPSATTATTLYTVPSATEAVASTVFVCNRGSSATTYRIAIRPAGASLANQHYVAFDATVGANDAIAITVGMTLEASDVVTVYAGNGDLSFNLFGSEIS
jgi:glucose-6-phosphate dehydrogenase assembly protein OpcA